MMITQKYVSLFNRICCLAILLLLALLPVRPALAQSVPETFGKFQPGDGAQNQPTALLLTWNSESSTANYEYCIDTVDNETCDTAWESTGPATSISITLAADTAYFWQVRAVNGSETISADAGTWWSFRTSPEQLPSQKRSTTQLTLLSLDEKTAEPNDLPLVNQLADPSFESSYDNPYWDEYDNIFGTPLCHGYDCGYWIEAHPRSGSGWAWFGGSTASLHTASISQAVVFPSCGNARLQFYFWIGYSFGGGADDQFFVKVDGVTVFSTNATQKGSYASYKLITLNVNQFANGGTHNIQFSHTNRNNDVGFNLDDVSLVGCPLITGNVGVAGATLTFPGGSTASDSSGNYAFRVPFGWTGTVTPSKLNYLFSPASRSYTSVNDDKLGQNYTATATAYTISGNAGVSGVTLSYFNGTPKTVISQGNGSYSITVPPGWTGKVTPSKTNYAFSPASRTYINVRANQLNQNYGAIPLILTINGNSGVGGVTLSYVNGTPKSVISQPDGSYSITVPRGWTGTVTPSKSGYIFSPAARSYSNVTDFKYLQDYTATQVYVISGNVGVAGVTLSYMDGSDKTVTSQANGDYSLTVSPNWSGTVIPSHTCYTFDPLDISYTDVTTDIGAQDFIPAFNAVDGCADILTQIGGVDRGRFGLAEGVSTRASFSGVNSGPVKLESTNAGGTVLATERVIYKVSNVNTSFTEMMALPNKYLDTTYWLPWYNNVDLDTQLRIANVSAETASVDIYIGGAKMTETPLTLEVGASTRLSFAGVNNGPVKIVSDKNIVAAERVIYKVNNLSTSFSEMMAQPNSQLDLTYWLPWYNNVDLDTQLRFANVNDAQASVRIYIGGMEMDGSPFILDANESTRISFSGINSGPVKIESDIPIVAAERVIYKVNNINTSFTEMMGLPAKQLNSIYVLPWYNNVDLDTQLRFANVNDTPATVHVLIGNVEMPGSPFILDANESTRVSFATINNGPVHIVSDIPIVAAERVIYKVNGVNTSFSEMMGLPNSALDSIYWLPWYNNVDLDTQLRFGVP